MSNLLGLSKASKTMLATAHPDLQKLVENVAAWFPLTVVYGYRNQEDQDKAHAEGKSNFKYPHSKHNHQPSLAVDIAPIKWSREKGVYIDWNDWREFAALAGVVLATARFLGIRVAWGADWDSDWDLDEHKLQDGPHFELIVGD